MTKTQIGSTMSTGAPGGSDRNSLSIGPDGPLLVHDCISLSRWRISIARRCPSASRTPRGRARSAC